VKTCNTRQYIIINLKWDDQGEAEKRILDFGAGNEISVQ
jgi:hypothetical protein